MEKTLCHRQSEGKKGALLAFADAACFLIHNKYFAECESLEQWWNDTTNEWSQNYQNITVICSHPGRILNDPSLTNKKGSIKAKHMITIDLNNDAYFKIEGNENQNEIKRILIVEPEPDIQYLYSLFTKQYGFSISDVNIVENGNKCLEYIFSNIDDNNNDNDYDIIILDTHLRDISGFEVARKIRGRLPHKKIILTTTNPLNNIIDIIDSIGIKHEDVILKPFSFSELFSILTEPRVLSN